jgi:hypothetical protein
LAETQNRLCQGTSGRHPKINYAKTPAKSHVKRYFPVEIYNSINPKDIFEKIDGLFTTLNLLSFK